MTTNDVFRKIKEISKRTPNPRPPIPVANIANEMQQVREQIMPMLTELKDMRLIIYSDVSFNSIRLTLLGFTVER